MSYKPGQKKQYESAREVSRIVSGERASSSGCIVRGFLLGTAVVGLSYIVGRLCNNETQGMQKYQQTSVGQLQEKQSGNTDNIYKLLFD